MRISAICFKLGKIERFDDFADHISGLARRAAAVAPDLMIFPEMVTFELLGLVPEGQFPEKFFQLPRFTEAYRRLFQDLAKETGSAILSGTHPTAADGRIYNNATLFTADGRRYEQPKCHLIPMESQLATPGPGIDVIALAGARLAILTCYDMEFPEAARIAALKGADILLCPSATLGPAGYWRVRHCAQARCIENQVYVVHCSLLGEIAELTFQGRAAMFCPCDRGFPPDGVLAESEIEQESILTADLDPALLHDIRRGGEVQPLRDLRRDFVAEIFRLASDRHHD